MYYVQGKNNIPEICFQFGKELVLSNFFYRLEFLVEQGTQKTFTLGSITDQQRPCLHSANGGLLATHLLYQEVKGRRQVRNTSLTGRLMSELRLMRGTRI